MRIKAEMTCPTRYFVCILSLLASTALAQEDRLRGPIDNLHRTALRGNVNPKAQAKFDTGPVDPSMRLSYMTIMLKPSPIQQADLEQLLTAQQDRRSPQYHKWLTPEQYADRFALSQADIGKIRLLLESQGFTTDHVARSRNWLAFSGTAAQVKAAFQTEIHYYFVDGKKHFANATGPMVPAALESMVIGLLGLDDFGLKAPRLRTSGLILSAKQMSATPHITNPDGTHNRAPDDLATIYDITPLYAKGIDGTGQNIVVAGQSNINPGDIAAFRGDFSLSTNVPQLLLVPGSQDPGITQDQDEADFDVEWAGAVARNATIIYVYSTNVLISAQYAISENIAPVISLSFGGCENTQSDALLSATRSQAQQANAHGITLVVSSGDSGAAGCDAALANPQATGGLSVYFPASVPEVTAVGGTEFADQSGNYWSANNSPTFASALSYVPEVAWNESSPTNGLAASGGGISLVYSRPSWQVAPGVVLSVNARAVPDVALTAAGHDDYADVADGSPGSFLGTSAATPVFAGIVALLNQHEGSTGEGNINPNLYRLAQTKIFHDITTGNNIVPCVGGTPNCTAGFLGYYAGPGFDPVTGLGSVDAYNLVADWNSPTPVSDLVPSCTPDPVYEQAPDSNGFSWPFTITLSETAGVGTTLTDFTVNGASAASQIVSFFGTSIIPAHSVISAPLGYKSLTVPTTIVFGFTGVDAGGRQWAKQLSVPFDGTPSSPTPTIAAVVNGASFASGGIVPGEIATLFGSNLTSSTGINLTSGLPLLTNFLNVSVLVNGTAAPLFAVDNVNGQQQINFQVPWEVANGPNANIAVSNNGATSAPLSVPVLAAQPGIINYAAAGGNFGVILHSNFQLADSGHPAVPGETMLIYCTGLGVVSSPPADGEAASGQSTVATANVTIGGTKAKVSFSGLAPGFVGLYQVNAEVPSGLPGGNQPVVISVGGSSSNSALLPTQ
jgi:uncharacterized protein (TIGR03437 family)